MHTLGRTRVLLGHGHNVRFQAHKVEFDKAVDVRGRNTGKRARSGGLGKRFLPLFSDPLRCHFEDLE